MKSTVTWKTGIDERPTAKVTLVAAAGDVKLRATVTDASILSKGSSLEGVVLALEKPDTFIVDYHVLKQDCHFKFMNRIRVLEKPLKFTYKHEWGNKSTDLHGTLELDDDNKVSANCTFGSKHKCKLKYIYNHNKGLTTLKPSYDVVNNCWDFAVSQKLFDINTLKASYKTSNDNFSTLAQWYFKGLVPDIKQDPWVEMVAGFKATWFFRGRSFPKLGRAVESSQC